jgi:murein L,D-transpeptidase YcbB/YkuD
MSMLRLVLIVVLSPLAIAACGAETPVSGQAQGAQTPVSTADADPAVVATVDQALAASQLEGLKWGNLEDVDDDLKAVYAAEGDRLVWFDGEKAVSKLEPALAAIARAGDYGLDPADYDAAWLAAQWPTVKSKSAPGRDRAVFDLALSVASARMMRAVHAGRIDPAAMKWNYAAAAKGTDVQESLRRAASDDDLVEVLDSLEPKFAHYQRAKKKLALYKAATQNGERPLVPELAKGQTKIAIGKPWAGVPLLVDRLVASGDLSPEAAKTMTPQAPLYDGAVVEAVKRFQERHGLDGDGVIGATTIKALNVPLSTRVRQLELALERGRWLPDLSDRLNVFVNVALFRLWATDPKSGEEPLRMNVVVGKSLNTQTPIFMDQMEYVVFRPYWNPPPSIIKGEIMPGLAKDPGYLAKHDMEIVANGRDDAASLPASEENMAKVLSGKLFVRQRPGPSNSLGLAKFIFPNSHDVYMHGTPAQQLFSRVRRDFSHGCIRLEDPARFAEWVLKQDPTWTRERIDAAMQGDKTMQVNLKEKITVVVFYDTVHVNSEDVVFFVNDIYGHDKALDAALQRGYPFPMQKPVTSTKH